MIKEVPLNLTFDSEEQEKAGAGQGLPLFAFHFGKKSYMVKFLFLVYRHESVSRVYFLRK